MATLPIEFGVITSGYGERINPITKRKEFHRGIDIGVAGNPSNIPVLCTKSGIVKWFDLTRVYNPETKKGSFGVVVYVLMADGWFAIYPHLNSINGKLIQVGAFLKEGSQIGIMGSTGLSTEKHLHYQEGLTMGGVGETREPLDIINGYLHKV
jgi:murein DD-endopeptidase MepM/ murein hydrolase activator NlpD